MSATYTFLGLLACICVAYTSAAPVWTAGSSDCTSATPLRVFGTPIDDLKSNLTITSSLAGVPDSGFCPQVPYQLNLHFNEWRVFILTTTQGSLSGTAGTPCANRLVGKTPVKTMALQLTLPCGASGLVTLTVASVQADKNSTKQYKQIILQDLPIAPPSACAISKCPGAGASGSTTATTTITTTSTGSTTGNPATFTLPNLAQLFKLPNKTSTGAAAVPDLASLLKLPKINFTMTTKPFVFPKIMLNLTVPPVPKNVVVDLKLPTVGAETLASLPAMMESVLQQFGQQLKQAAAQNGIEIVDESLGNTTGSAASAAGALNFEAWVKAATALVTGRQLLSDVDVDNEMDQNVAAEAYPSLDGPSQRLARTLLAVNSTVKSDAQKITSFISVVFSDVFAVSYAGFKVGNSALKLLIAYLKASSSGTIEVDEIDLLDFTANVASLGAELSDFMSRVTKANADLLNPLTLSFKFSDLIAKLKNDTSTPS